MVEYRNKRLVPMQNSVIVPLLVCWAVALVFFPRNNHGVVATVVPTVSRTSVDEDEDSSSGTTRTSVDEESNHASTPGPAGEDHITSPGRSDDDDDLPGRSSSSSDLREVLPEPRHLPADTAIVFAGVSGADEILAANLKNLILPYQPAHVFICGVNNFGEDALFNAWGRFIKGVNFSPHPRSNPLLHFFDTKTKIMDKLGVTEDEFRKDEVFIRDIFNATSNRPHCLVQPLQAVLDFIRCFLMIESTEREMGFGYERLVLSRFDNIFLTKHPDLLRPRGVGVAVGEMGRVMEYLGERGGDTSSTSETSEEGAGLAGEEQQQVAKVLPSGDEMFGKKLLQQARLGQGRGGNPLREQRSDWNLTAMARFGELFRPHIYTRGVEGDDVGDDVLPDAADASERQTLAAVFEYVRSKTAKLIDLMYSRRTELLRPRSANIPASQPRISNICYVPCPGRDWSSGICDHHAVCDRQGGDHYAVSRMFLLTRALSEIYSQRRVYDSFIPEVVLKIALDFGGTVVKRYRNSHVRTCNRKRYEEGAV